MLGKMSGKVSWKICQGHNGYLAAPTEAAMTVDEEGGGKLKNHHSQLIEQERNI